MVSSATDARGEHALSPDSNRVSLRTVSVSGKRNSKAQRRPRRNAYYAKIYLCRDLAPVEDARHWRPIRESLGNRAVRRSAWWAREDSNLQPSGYERHTLVGKISNYWPICAYP
jgi:hypothetical protein